MKKLAIVALLAITLSAAISSCCACRKGSPQIGKLENVTWKLIELNLDPIENSGITLTFDPAKKMMYGTAPCNNFFGGYSLFDAKDNIKIGNVGSTRKACPEMALENKFTAQLSEIVRIKIEDEYLMLINSQGALVAVLTEVKK